MNFFKTILLLLMSIVAYSCTTNTTPCTAEFRMATVTVLTPDGEPADSVQITATISSSGEQLDPCEQYNGICQTGTDGEHLVFHDGLREELGEGEETVTVTGTKGELEFTEAFTFRDNGCHIEQVAGPDTVTLAS